MIPAMAARHLYNHAEVPESDLEAQHSRIASIIPDSIAASMSPTISEAATVAINSNNDRKRPTGQRQGVARPVKKSNKRKSILGSRRKKKRKQEEENFWPIKDILEEEVTPNGTTRYLVAWEGVDSDGRPYKPDWVEDVTNDALQAWQAKQRECQNDDDLDLSRSDIDLAPSILSSQEASEKRKQEASLSQSGSSSEDDQAILDPTKLHHRKRRRTIILDSQDIKDLSSINKSSVFSTGFDDLPRQKRQKIVVELPQKSDFDHSAYLTVQLSQEGEQQPDAQTESQIDLQSFSVSSSKGHFSSNRTIPDSQEPSAFSKSDVSNNGSQLRIDLVGDSFYSQPEETRNRNPGVPQAIQRDLEVSAEIPSHQPDWVESKQNLESNLAPSFGSIAPFPSGSEVTAADAAQTSPSAFAFQTQEPSNSQPWVPTSSSALSETNAQQDSVDSQVALESFQTLLNPSRHTTSLNGSRLVPSNHSQISSQAAQIVPHTLSQSGGNPSQSHFLRTFSVYNDHQDDEDIIPESSRQLSSGQKYSQNSTHASNELDGNHTLSSSYPLQREPIPRPQSVRPLSESCTDKLSYSQKAEQALPVIKRPFSLPPVQKPSTSKLSDRLVARHSSQPATSTNKMEDVAPSSERRLTARERMRQVLERNRLSTESSIAPPVEPNVQRAADGSDPVAPRGQEPAESAEAGEPLTISPALLIPTTEIRIHSENDVTMDHGSEDVTVAMSPVFEGTTIESNYDPILEEQPETLDPSALTLSIEHDMMEPDIEDDGSPSIPTDDMQPQSDGLDSTGEAPQLDDDVEDVQEPNILPYIDSKPMEFIVTLPLASNIRPQYVEIIKEHRDDLTAYNAAFQQFPYRAPSPALVSKVDKMFNELLDICDLPPSLEALEKIEKISPEKAAKYTRTTNSKYAFVGHFLEQLSMNTDAEKRVLIFARPGPIIRLLNNLLHTIGMQSEEVLGAPAAINDKSWANEKLLVTVYPTSDKPYDLQSDYDVVIAFDHSYRQEFMPVHLNENPPITLVLITTTSIQHLNLRISEKIEPISRKNYLLLAVCASTTEMLSGEPGNREAHHIAEHFVKYVNSPYDDEFYWSPQEPADNIFANIAASSQMQGAQSSMLADPSVSAESSRKRSLDVVEVENDAKRPKLVPGEIVPVNVAVTAHIPDDLKEFIGNDVEAIEGSPIVGISVAKAEALAAKMAKLEAELEKTRVQREQFRELADRTKREVDSWTTSMNKIQPKYMAALRDRGIFQKERDVAVRKQQEMATLLQSTKDRLTNTTQENMALRTKLSEAQESLLHGSNPELARLVRIEKELEETRTRIQDLDNKNASANKDRDYAYGLYQEASQGALDLKKENDELQRRIVELTRKADDNIVKINQIQRDNESRELVRLLDQQKTIVKDRENELSQARLQLASIKNGRQTRQSSVPRSPRLNVSSPRNQGRRAATETATGTAHSRQSSPAAMSTFEVGGNLMPGMGSLFAGQQQGSGRFAHLRD